MGLFHKKQTDDGVDLTQEEQFLDDNVRQELRNHGRWYFEKVINENGSLFKRDLDATIAQINVELKDHVTNQLDIAIAQMNTELKEHVTVQLQEQFRSFTTTMKQTQDATLSAMNQSAETLRQQQTDLTESVKTNVAEQQSLLHTAFEENKAHVVAMNDAQEEAIRTLKSSVEALQQQHNDLVTTLKTDMDRQKEIIINQFEKDMASIVERYLLDALGDQFDLKSQLPQILKQLEANKQAMVDDIKL